MTPSLDQSQCDRQLWRWLALLLLVANGCAYLAPGVAPIACDPPATASYGYGATAEKVANTETIHPNDEFTVDEGTAESANLEQGDLIPVNSKHPDRYIARQYPQYPRVYPAPPPPSTYTVPNSTPPANNYQGLQPPSVYQLPPGYQNGSSTSAAPLPQTYQTPANLPAPLSGVPMTQSQPLPPPVNTPPPIPRTVLPTPAPQMTAPPMSAPPMSAPPMSAPMGEYGLSDPSNYGAPGYGAPNIGDSGLGNLNDPYAGAVGAPPSYIPNTRTADLEITGYPARTGRIMVGGAVNSDAGVTGQLTVDERNFDITRFPKSFQDLASGTAFRGAGQTLRLEAVPGSQFKRYTASFAEPNLFGYLPISLGLSGYLYTRNYRDYNEERLGGRMSLGYRISPDLSISTGINAQNVEIKNPRVTGVQALDEVLGNNQLYTGEVRLTHDTRNSPFQASEGHFFEIAYEQAFGDFDYSRVDIENRNYLLLTQRPDESGKQTLTFTTRLGFSGENTPLFENYFAGGYSTIRGFNFRGASPVDSDVQVGGRFQWLNTLEYMFPITADDSFKGVAFVDFGTVERDIKINKEDFRVAPGLGLRVAIPMLGPAPLAFDFAYPVSQADTDQKRIFSFYMSTLR